MKMVRVAIVQYLSLALVSETKNAGDRSSTYGTSDAETESNNIGHGPSSSPLRANTSHVEDDSLPWLDSSSVDSSSLKNYDVACYSTLVALYLNLLSFSRLSGNA